MQPTFSLNPFTDLSVMWSYPYLRHALIAGTIIAIVAGAVGWVMVLRRESFLGHTLAIVSFPGAAVAIALGISPQIGYYLSTAVAALIAGRGTLTHNSSDPRSSATTGTVQAVALAAGLLAVASTSSFIDSTTSLLFGSFLGVTTSDVIVIGVVGVVALVALIAIARPLILATFDPTAAEATGLPVAGLSTTFSLILAVVVASTSQITGALLVFALLVMPPSTAQLLSRRIWSSCALSMLIGLVVLWVGVGLSFFVPELPLGFCITSVGMAGFIAANVATHLPTRRLAVAR